MAGRKIGFSGELGKTVPGANQLAVIATIDAVAQQRSEFLGDTAFELDGQVGNTTPGVKLVWAHNGLRRANLQALCAIAAMIFHRFTDRQG